MTVAWCFIPAAGPALPLLQENKLIALTSAPKNAILHCLMCYNCEAGIKDASYHFYTGLFLPAGLPRYIERWHPEALKASARLPCRNDLRN